jgi:DNA-binding transcriptional LysR family regulator
VSLEQDLADWMQIGNQILDKFHHDSPGGLKFEMAAETPLMLIRFNTLLEQVNQRYPQATVKMRQWDYDSLDAITRGEVDLGFTGRETHPRSRELLKLMPWFIDYEILFSDRPAFICAKIIRRFRKRGISTPSCAIHISVFTGNAAIPGHSMKC